MRGEFIPVWADTWGEIWVRLGKHKDAPLDFFCDLYRSQVKPPVPPTEPPPPTKFDQEGAMALQSEIQTANRYKEALSTFTELRAKYEECCADNRRAKSALRVELISSVKLESDAVSVLERAAIVLEHTEIESTCNQYFLLVEKFIDRYSLRYDLRRPFTLHPTPSGVFTKLCAEVATRCDAHAALSNLMRDYREAFQDLKLGTTPGRINTCLQKHVNLLEGLTSLDPTITSTTLGQMCGEIKTWPSSAVSEAAKALYGFASDHTGLRHGTIKKAKFGKTPITFRDMEMRDLVAVSTIFTGLTAYLYGGLDSNKIYGG